MFVLKLSGIEIFFVVVSFMILIGKKLQTATNESFFEKLRIILYKSKVR